MAGLFVVRAWIGCGSGGKGMLGFEKTKVELVGLSLNRVTPSLIRIGLLCQPQLASCRIFAFLFSERADTPSRTYVSVVRFTCCVCGDNLL